MTVYEQLAQERALEAIRRSRLPIPRYVLGSLVREERRWKLELLGLAARELADANAIRERLARGEKP